MGAGPLHVPPTPRVHLTQPTTAHCSPQANIQLMDDLAARVEAEGRDYPIPKISERVLARMAAEEARAVSVGFRGFDSKALDEGGSGPHLHVTLAPCVELPHTRGPLPLPFCLQAAIAEQEREAEALAECQDGCT